ncbi:MAG: Phosphoadenosine phosphosulfate reductase [Dehalococcoidia bacterium]|nr:Phosphoadenosine phosphosulfate reductase [Chloroflexota bacterium]
MDEADKLVFLGWAKTAQFQRKVERSKEAIATAIALGEAYVACSWGKDSTALLHLAQQVKPDIATLHFCTTYADLIGNFGEVRDRYLLRYPDTQYWETDIDDQTTIPQAAASLKHWREYPVVLSGIRREENQQRRIAIDRYGITHKYAADRGWRSFPLAYWKTLDVWAYIFSYQLPYLNLYQQKGSNARTSNVFVCREGWAKNPSLLVQLGILSEFKRYSPKFYQKLVEDHPEIAAW